MSLWGAVASVGSSLLGGLFGKKKKNETTTTTSYVDYARMRDDSEAAGFNPLTALRNGGSAGFSVSTSTTPSTPLSSPSIGGALQSGVNAFLENFDPYNDDAREAEYGIVQAQLNALQNDPRLRIGFGSVPSYTSKPKKKGSSDLSPWVEPPIEAGHPQSSKIEGTTITNPFPPKWNIHVNPNVPDAASYEERYGDSEIAQMIYGGGIFLGDIVHNYRRAGNGIKALKDGVVGALSKRFGSDDNWYRDGGVTRKPFLRKTLRDNHHTDTNIYGLPRGQIPSMGKK